MSEKLTTGEIVEALELGDRSIVAEAEDIYEVNDNNVEVRHDACDGEVVVQLTAVNAWELDEDGEGEMLLDEVVRRI